MNLIHRQIFLSVALTCGAAMGLFAFVLMAGNVLKDLLPLLLAGQLAPGVALELVALLLPFVVTYALPMGMLTGVLLVLGRMSSDREITALRSAGLSVAWLSTPILFCGLLGTALCLAINFQFMPVARVVYHQELAAAVRQNPLTFIVPRTFIRDFPGLVLYVGEKHGAELREFWLWELDSQNRVRRFARAESARLAFDEPHNQLVLTLNHASAEVRDEKDPENYAEMHGASAWDQATVNLPLGKVLGDHAVPRKLKWFTFAQLMREWVRLGRPDPEAPAAEQARQRMQVQIAIQEKFASAFSVLSFTLVAIPLGIRVSRRETSANLGIGLALAMAYFFATIVVGWFDGHPEWRPDLLMWLPNLGFQVLGWLMFRSLDR